MRHDAVMQLDGERIAQTIIVLKNHFDIVHDTGCDLPIIKLYRSAERILHLMAPDIAHAAERIISLAPYAVEVRYEVEYEPDADQATEAVQTAKEVYELIKRVIEKK